MSTLISGSLDADLRAVQRAHTTAYKVGGRVITSVRLGSRDGGIDPPNGRDRSTRQPRRSRSAPPAAPMAVRLPASWPWLHSGSRRDGIAPYRVWMMKTHAS